MYSPLFENPFVSRQLESFLYLMQSTDSNAHYKSRFSFLNQLSRARNRPVIIIFYSAFLNCIPGSFRILKPARNLGINRFGFSHTST